MLNFLPIISALLLIASKLRIERDLIISKKITEGKFEGLS